MASIAENYHRIRDRLRELERQNQRPDGSVLLLAVSKTHPVSSIHQAWLAGARDFGENYVQEALDKMQALQNEADTGDTGGAAGTSEMTDIRWHFIGPLQSNKTRDVSAHFDWVHSIDRLKTARRLSEQRPAHLPPLNVCIQVNISGEDSKSGVALEDAAELCAAVAELPGLTLRGLMAIPAPQSNHEQQRAVYHPLSRLFTELQQQHGSMDTLSIGMSDDLEAAVAEGATIVRIGTAIFGPRQSTAG